MNKHTISNSVEEQLYESPLKISIYQNQILNPKQAGGGAFDAPPPLVFCPSVLIIDTFTMNIFSF